MIIAGFENVCVLDRGLTYWHEAFSEEFKNAKGDSKWGSTYSTFQSEKPSDKSQTPNVEFPNNENTIEDKVAERIHILLDKGNKSLFISASNFSNSYNPDMKWYNGNYVIYTAINYINYNICHSDREYVYGPNSTVLYVPPWQFRADRDLLTLRLDKNIVMYSPVGQISSFGQAYLHFLGYDKAVTIKYGSISIMGFRYEIQVPIRDEEGNIIDIILIPTPLTPFYFDKDPVRNYEYETGT
jgi:hypothetical protein